MSPANRTPAAADIFLSANSQDAGIASKVSAMLHSDGLAVWQAAGDLYGSPGWPRTVGEAIAAAPAFVLLWSAASSISHIVEYEWHMAGLLKRKIMLVALDNTPVRPPLEPGHRLRWGDTDLQAQMGSALEAPWTPPDEDTVAEILRKLSRFNETKPAQVTRKMRIVYFNSRIENPVVHVSSGGD